MGFTDCFCSYIGLIDPVFFLKFDPCKKGVWERVKCVERGV